MKLEQHDLILLVMAVFMGILFILASIYSNNNDVVFAFELVSH